jgi:hypothetical protein
LPSRHLWSFLACAILASRLAVAHDNEFLELPQLEPPKTLELVPVETSPWFDGFWTKSILRFFAPPLPVTISEPVPDLADIDLLDEPVSVSPACAVEPLPILHDAEALAFEAQVGTALIVDLEGLTRTTATALERLQHVVARAGGNIALTSAYRPTAYQEHLQAVWDKWITELRRNRTEDCQALRVQVEEEFSRHQLLYTQRPVGASDHTLGIGVDASISLPRLRNKRRRISVDRLARQAGFSRPEPRRDPVHFRLIGGRV